MPYTGTQGFWVDVSDQVGGNRRTCDNGTTVDESNPGPPGWAFSPPDPDKIWASGNIEAGDCDEGINILLASDFLIAPGGHTIAIAANGTASLSIEEDLSGETPPGSVTEEVIRGTITVTAISPSVKGDCDCSTFP
jgi:hypothetical protein